MSDDNYSGFLDYLLSEHRYGSIAVICIIVIAIIIGFALNDENTKTPIWISIILSMSLFINPFVGIIY